MKRFPFYFVIVFLGCAHPRLSGINLLLPNEPYFKSVRPLTDQGNFTKAHWSFDGDWITCQYQAPLQPSERSPCDQIYELRPDGSTPFRVSSELGNSIDPFFLSRDIKILYSSTYPIRKDCSTETDAQSKNLKSINFSYQIYGYSPDRHDTIPLEPGAPKAYNAETSVCKDGTVVFTSSRSGDLQLYRAKLDSAFGTFENVQKITNSPGYHGAAQFSPDCKQIVWQHFEPKSKREKKEFTQLFAQKLLDLKRLEIWIANADGSNARPLTHLDAKSSHPTFTPDGNQVIFSSNQENPQTSRSNLYLISLDGNGLAKISNSEEIDDYPSFSPNGKYLVFSSVRGDRKNLNLFVAEWRTPNPE